MAASKTLQLSPANGSVNLEFTLPEGRRATLAIVLTYVLPSLGLAGGGEPLAVIDRT